MQWVDTAGKTKPSFYFHVIFAPFLHSANIQFSNNRIQIRFHRFFFLLSLKYILKKYILGVISCTSQCNPQFLCLSQAPLLLLLVIPRWSDGALLVPQLPPTSLLVPQLLPSSITFAVVLSIKVLQPHLE